VSTSATFTGLTAGNAYDFSVVAVGAGGTSSPGTISSVYTLPPSVTNLTNQSSGRFVAVGTSSNAATAEDGTTLTWTKRFMPSSQTTNTAASSDDGINWTARTLSATSLWSAVTCYTTSGRFVAVSSSSTTAASLSTDGQTWSAQTLPSPAQVWNSVAVGPSTSTTPYVSSKTNSSITISFQAGNGATSYSISGTGLTTATGFSSPITFSGLAANTLYPTSGTFTITSINASGTGGTVSVPATTTLA